MDNQYSVYNILDNLISGQTKVCSSLINTKNITINCQQQISALSTNLNTKRELNDYTFSNIISAAGYYDTTQGKVISGGVDGNFLSANNPTFTGTLLAIYDNINISLNKDGLIIHDDIEDTDMIKVKSDGNLSVYNKIYCLDEIICSEPIQSSRDIIITQIESIGTISVYDSLTYLSGNFNNYLTKNNPIFTGTLQTEEQGSFRVGQDGYLYCQNIDCGDGEGIFMELTVGTDGITSNGNVSVNGNLSATNIFYNGNNLTTALNNKLNVNNPSGTGSLTIDKLQNGYNCVATGTYSHAQGNSTSAISNYSHTEGQKTYTIGLNAHAQGDSTSACAAGAHVEGYGTRSWSPNNKDLKTGVYSFQHIEGKFNSLLSKDLKQMQCAVGGGTSDSNRKTIYKRDWNGNIWATGVINASGFYDTTQQKFITGGYDGNFLPINNPSGTGTLIIDNIYNKNVISANNIDFGSNNIFYDSYIYATNCISIGSNNTFVQVVNQQHEYIYASSVFIIGNNNSCRSGDSRDNIHNLLVIGSENILNYDSCVFNDSLIVCNYISVHSNRVNSDDLPKFVLGNNHTFDDNYDGKSIQNLQGKYFATSSLLNTDYQLVVGGGTSDSNRKNIYTRDYFGNIWSQGTISAANFITSGGISLQQKIISGTIPSNNIYTANYNVADLHKITLSADTSLLVTNIPEGQSLVVYCNNDAVKSLSFGGNIILNESGNFVISFININNKISLLGQPVKLD